MGKRFSIRPSNLLLRVIWPEPTRVAKISEAGLGVPRTANRNSVFLSTFNIDMLSCISGKDLKAESCQFLSSSVVLRAISRSGERAYCFRPRSRSARRRQSLVALAGAVVGVDKNGKMAAFFYGGNDGEVQRVARKIGKGAHAALAEHDVVIALGEDVLGRHEELVERGGHAALEENGFPGAAGAFEQGEVLHVARADLDDVGVLFDEVEAFVVDSFGNDAEAVSGADFRKNLESVFTDALKAVRRSAGLVGAPAAKAHAAFLQPFADGPPLLLRFDGAGAGNEGFLITADDDFAGVRGDSNDAVFLLGVAADQFVRLADLDALDDAGDSFEDAEVDGALVAGDTDRGAEGPRHGLSLQAEAFNALANFADLLLGGVRLHDDEHGWLPRRRE